ncbi:lanthionine synthetase LanC family protein [Ruegeria jejuensis]|uniref:lanthionine synthetase LanC family protein n=1 Tax=Ruegeria jejuensis TaxID=3233338 RepID=UPI00355B568F
MTVDVRYVLPPDLLILPVTELARDLRDRFDHQEGDFALTRPRSRAVSSVIDAGTARLLEEFKAPRTIVDAVIAFSSTEKIDPRATLEDAFPVLRGFMLEGYLVAADSELAASGDTLLSPGDHVDGHEILELVHAVSDSEIYLARKDPAYHVALKFARPSLGPSHASLLREAEILKRLDGGVNPHLLGQGEHGECAYIVLTWHFGVDIQKASSDARQSAGRDRGATLLDLAVNVLAAYAHLHGQGLLHGDVHPRNLLVDSKNNVTILDYGLGVDCDPGHRPENTPRRGIDFFMEPEIAAARLGGGPLSPPTVAGEQYSIAALLYLLLTGEQCIDFPLEEEMMLGALLEQPPLSFAHHGAMPLPAVEGCLNQALSKKPSERFATTQDFLDAFLQAASQDRQGLAAGNRHPIIPKPADSVLDDVLSRLAVPGDLFAGGLAAPTASCMNGGAGFAYALLRIAAARDDSSLLPLADLWATQAGAAAEEGGAAFWNDELDIVPETVGRDSLYHAASGVHCVRALVALGLGDVWTCQPALDAYVAAAERHCAETDVAFGKAGLLIGTTILFQALTAQPDLIDTRRLRAVGNALQGDIWRLIDEQPAISDSDDIRSIGMAHGWAGMLYAILLWSQTMEGTAPAGLCARLDELADLGRPFGRGLRWPVEAGRPAADNSLAGSWCNGAAGFVHLWTAAHEVFDDSTFLDLATLAAWTAFDWPAETGDLCCGLGGRAYALLRIYQHTEEPAWLARTRELAARAAASVRTSALRRDSLYRGEVGVAALEADLLQPQHACMPLFQPEGWNTFGRSSE